MAGIFVSDTEKEFRHVAMVVPGLRLRCVRPLRRKQLRCCDNKVCRDKQGNPPMCTCARPDISRARCSGSMFFDVVYVAGFPFLANVNNFMFLGFASPILLHDPWNTCLQNPKRSPR